MFKIRKIGRFLQLIPIGNGKYSHKHGTAGGNISTRTGRSRLLSAMGIPVGV